MEKRVQRVVRVLRTLEEGGPYTPDTLSSKLGVSRRTVFRDIEELRRAGYRIDFDHAKHAYNLHAGRYEPKGPSSRDLLELLLQASLAPLPQTPRQRKQAAHAAKSLSGVLPPSMRDFYEAAREYIRPVDASTAAVAARTKVDVILNAITKRRGVFVMPLANPNCPRCDEWLVAPLQITLADGRWILEGRILPTTQGLRADLSKVIVEPTDHAAPEEFQAIDGFETSLKELL